jgi:hypothetical protein
VSRFTPRKAVRTGQRARVAFAGPSGSGKTWTALEAAKTLAEGGPILVLDTERGSASLYSDFFDFEVIEWEPPYDPRELSDVIDEHDEQYAVIVVDSLTHFWEGEGGTRDIVDAAAARARGNSYAGWKEGTPAQNDMIAGILQARCHVVCTMRSKTEYVLEERNGRQVPRKIGMAPIQRAGLEYEFTVTADLDYEHTLLVDKTRCHALAGRMFKLGHTVEFAETLRDWLGSAEPTATHGDIEKVKESMNAIDDPEMRTDVKQAFVHRFGRPERLLASQVDEALAWVSERTSGDGRMISGEGADDREAPDVPEADPPQLGDDSKPSPETMEQDALELAARAARHAVTYEDDEVPA